MLHRNSKSIRPEESDMIYKGLLIKLGIGITFAITVAIGPYLLSALHTVGGETRVSQALNVGGVSKGKSLCILKCPPGSKVEDFETVDVIPDYIALSATRSGGEFTSDVGLQKAFFTPGGKFGVTLSATTTVRDKDAIHLFESAPIKPFVPQRLDTLIKDYKVRNNLSPRPLTGKPLYGLDPVLKALDNWPTRKPARKVVIPSGMLLDAPRVYWDSKLQKAIFVDAAKLKP
jgi:hypothetical protein